MIDKTHHPASMIPTGRTIIGMSTTLLPFNDDVNIDDPTLSERNDILQYPGFLVFRPLVSADKHNPAPFLTLRGWMQSNQTHPDSTTRPYSDIAIGCDIDDRSGEREGE